MADKVESNKIYNTPIEGASWEKRNYTGVPESTKQQMIASEKNNYENKAKRFYAILGNDSLKHPKFNTGNTELDARVKAIAEENPSEYYELIQLAKDIKASNTTDETLLKNAQNVIYSAEAWTHQQGIMPVKREWPQQKAIQNNEQAKQTLSNIPGMTGAQLVTNMHNLRDWYNYEIKLYNAIPDTAANQNAIKASEARIENYRNTYMKYIKYVEGLNSNPSLAYDFYSQYLLNPFEPLTQEQQRAFEVVIAHYLPYAKNKEDNAVNVFSQVIGGQNAGN